MPGMLCIGNISGSNQQTLESVIMARLPDVNTATYDHSRNFGVQAECDAFCE